MKKGNVPIGIILAVAVIIIVAIVLIFPTREVTGNQLKKFSSCDELKNFVKTNTETYSYGWGGVFTTLTTGIAPMMAQTTGAAKELSGGERSEDYSKTNIQVEGVDEADIVKNDGKYIYTVSGNKVVIVDAYPANNAKILSEIDLNGNVQELFINKDKLVVFGNRYGNYETVPGKYHYSSEFFINVYDVSDRNKPILKRNLSLEGNYFDSRMIGNYVYVIINQPFYAEEEIPLPSITSSGQSKSVCNCPDVYYFDYSDYSYTFATILSLNTQNDNEDLTNKVFLMGTTQNMFVSLNNIYITYTKHMSSTYYTEKLINNVYIPSVPTIVATRINEIKRSVNNTYETLQKIGEVVQNYSQSLNEQERANFEKIVQEKMMNLEKDIAKETEKTVVHKISITDGKIEYKNQGEAPGNVLNQFSMDEYNGYFRIATTSGHVSRGESTSANHVYVLDNDLKIVGKLEDLAPGEKIYSARFIGDRCYLVTFKKIDPLFVIDLKDPTNPKVLGKLKIPGYSDYLHPYDENHIIGIGKETAEAEQGNFAWYQGVKISLFDVSDVEHPKEVSKYNIGDRGTDSYALHDHKAFLFSKSKNLLVIPILLAEIDEEKYPSGVQPNTYGDYVWQGAYVFDLTLENGFVLKGKVSHLDNDTEMVKTGYYYYSSPYDVKRSLYIDNVLYTISSKMIKMNDLNNLGLVNNVELPYQEEYQNYLVG